MKKLKIAVIGVGNISQVHIQAYLQNEHVELVALCDINEKVLLAAGERYHIARLYTDEATMLQALPEIGLLPARSQKSDQPGNRQKGTAIT